MGSRTLDRISTGIGDNWDCSGKVCRVELCFESQKCIFGLEVVRSLLRNGLVHTHDSGMKIGSKVLHTILAGLNAEGVDLDDDRVLPGEQVLRDVKSDFCW